MIGSSLVVPACLVAAALAAATGATHPAASASAPEGSCAAGVEPSVVDVVRVEGIIDPPTSRFLLRQLEAAADRRSAVVVVELDTPGGLDVSMRQMVQRILASDVPVVVWVAPSGARAASAGVFITMASHVAAMAPGTSLGAAHPVNLGGGQDEVSSTKATNDAAALLRSIASERGRNVEWADRAVRESFALGAEEAQQENVIDLLVGSRRTLLGRIDGRDVRTAAGVVTLATACSEIHHHSMGLFERILHVAITPEIAYFLLLLGLLGIVFEIQSPVMGAAGSVGSICLILALYALSILPTSWAGVALVVLAVVFFVIDLQTAGAGVLTGGAVAALLGGSVLLFADADPSLRLGWSTIGAAAATMLGFFLVAMTAVVRARRAPPVSGAESMVGMLGEARSDLTPEGQVLAKGTLWKARTDGDVITKGTRVRVRAVSGLLLVVERASPTSPSEARTP